MEHCNALFPTILPNVIRALVVSYLEEDDYMANQIRKECINITIKDTRNNCTYKNGALHSFNDYPAKIINTTEEKNNPDFPDEQNEQYYIKHTWYNYGCKHRSDDKPAEVYYYNNKKIHIQRWYQNNYLHRDNDNPALYFIVLLGFG